MENAMTDDAPECASADCWMAPTHDAMIVLRSKKHRRAVVTSPLGVSFCGGCATGLTLDDVVDDETWQSIVDGFERSGREPPDRELCELDLQPRTRKDW
jgi:hypothetical protein